MTDRKPLIVVLPGIGGSVLARPGRPDDVVWDAGKGDIAGVVFRPDRLSIDEAPHLEPLGLTESTKFLGFTVVAGYERLLDQLTAFGTIDRRGDPQHPVPGADVVAVPYDFRRSIIEAAERLDAVVCAHLAGASQAERAGRVTVVAHSMGGLVARVWLGLLGRWPTGITAGVRAAARAVPGAGHRRVTPAAAARRVRAGGVPEPRRSPCSATGAGKWSPGPAPGWPSSPASAGPARPGSRSSWPSGCAARAGTRHPAEGRNGRQVARQRRVAGAGGA